MIYKIVLFPVAKQEFEESFDWYEEQLIGLGSRFISIVNNAFDIISINPEAFPKRKNLLRMMSINEFPYLIIYEVVEKESIINILHTSRNPKLKYKRK
jgi:hypothetical protein